jgi:hypothetical protein
MVSIEYDRDEELDRLDFPVFSVRHLATSTNSQQQLFQSKYPIESMTYDQSIYTDDFHFRIVHSFSHNGFIYFLYTITNKILPDSCNRMDHASDTIANQTTTKVVTRLLRVCDAKAANGGGAETNRNGGGGGASNQDTIDQFSNMYNSGASSATLTETVIDCDDQVDGKFHLLQSAHFQPLAESPDDSLLFLSFNNTGKKKLKSVKNEQKKRKLST